MRVETYYNLHKRCLSYRFTAGPKDQRFVRHAQLMILNDVKFAVQPAGRARVLMENRKNVHAFVRGDMTYMNNDYYGNMDDYNEENLRRQNYRQITYNPYGMYDSFVYRDTGVPIKSASQVVIVGKNIYLSGKDTTHALSLIHI